MEMLWLTLGCSVTTQHCTLCLEDAPALLKSSCISPTAKPSRPAFTPRELSGWLAFRRWALRHLRVSCWWDHRGMNHWEQGWEMSAGDRGWLSASPPHRKDMSATLVTCRVPPAEVTNHSHPWDDTQRGQARNDASTQHPQPLLACG